MSARCREARTSLTPENEGLPETTIILAAALVSSRRRETSARFPEGMSALARSRAAPETASAASSSSTAGSSSVWQDF